MNKENVKRGEELREEILKTIIGYVQEHGYAPTMRELEVEFNLGSISTVRNHIMIMLERGMIETDVASVQDILSGVAQLSARAIRVPGYRFVKI